MADKQVVYGLLFMAFLSGIMVGYGLPRVTIKKVNQCQEAVNEQAQE